MTRSTRSFSGDACFEVPESASGTIRRAHEDDAGYSERSRQGRAAMFRPDRMKFGIFLAPFHRHYENPTLSLERDMRLIELLDELDYDEAWVGEHHSAGWETIASPEVFMGIAAQRTRRIMLGTGVISLPYHHPLMVANRMVLLDHLTRGRVMLGVGPGALASDAYMFCI